MSDRAWPLAVTRRSCHSCAVPNDEHRRRDFVNPALRNVVLGDICDQPIKVWVSWRQMGHVSVPRRWLEIPLVEVCQRGRTEHIHYAVIAAPPLSLDGRPEGPPGERFAQEPGGSSVRRGGDA
ncbi:hypothetical protein [Micromonospora sp. CA-244673]|uniref:hypothetical protein n=1 Tax=Micromonospora sp. CA-244673 TaxID=3239958 RepID=UPI003D949AE5